MDNKEDTAGAPKRLSSCCACGGGCVLTCAYLILFFPVDLFRTAPNQILHDLAQLRFTTTRKTSAKRKNIYTSCEFKVLEFEYQNIWIPNVFFGLRLSSFFLPLGE